MYKSKSLNDAILGALQLVMVNPSIHSKPNRVGRSSLYGLSYQPLSPLPLMTPRPVSVTFLSFPHYDIDLMRWRTRPYLCAIIAGGGVAGQAQTLRTVEQ